jgi:dTDP-4-amino-4,6-dideoxygalactose transaminase
MLDVCSKHGCKLGGGHQYRFHPRFVQAAEIVRNGDLGELKEIQGQVVGSLANNGPHLIDTIRFVLGDMPAVSVEGRCERARGGCDRGVPAEDYFEGKIVFESGLHCYLKTGDRSDTFFSIGIVGRRASLEVTWTSLAINGRTVSAEPVSVPDYRDKQFREFLQWVKNTNGSFAADAQSSAETVHILLALYEAARLGYAMPLPLVNKGDVIRQLFQVPSTENSRASLTSTSRSGVLVSQPLASEGGSRLSNRWYQSTPSISVAEWIGVSRVIFSKRLNSVDGGHVVKAFEEEFAKAYGVKHAVASTSGTAAIHVALGALNPEPCDEIITTPITDMGSVIPILTTNCIPVFADVDPATGNMTAATIEKKITPKTKAVVLVHLFGRPADIQPILELLRPRGIALIEDCAQAHYADYHGRKVGSFGDFGCFSLQQSKQMTCGDGGVTLINREDLVDRAELFADKGWNRKQGLRTHLFLGMNYRMTELQGAVARAQLRKLPKMIERRYAMATLLSDRLRKIGPMMIPPVVAPDTRPSWWMYPFTLSHASGINIEEFYGELCAEGVQVAREYVPQAVFSYIVLKEQRTYGDSRYPFPDSYVPPDINDYPGFLEFKKNLIYMGWSHNVTIKDVEFIARAVEKVVMALKPSVVSTPFGEAIPHNRPAVERT